VSDEIINKSLIYIYKDYENKKDKEGKHHISNIDSKLNELKNENENQKKNIIKLLEENTRLNNIITELEKVLLEYKKLCVNYEFDDVYACEYNYYQQIAIADFIKSFVLDKLKELKENSKWKN